jgi:hypothetical protein
MGFFIEDADRFTPRGVLRIVDFAPIQPRSFPRAYTGTNALHDAPVTVLFAILFPGATFQIHARILQQGDSLYTGWVGPTTTFEAITADFIGLFAHPPPKFSCFLPQMEEVGLGSFRDNCEAYLMKPFTKKDLIA